jgi:propanediol dehydratase small subunit
LSRNLGTLTSWNPLGHPRPVTRLLYLYLQLRVYRALQEELRSRYSVLKKIYQTPD